MAKFILDVTIEVDAEDAHEAWDKVNTLVSDIDGVTNVSEPEED
jgi:hypothetical protein